MYETIPELYKHYTQIRSIKLNLEQFVLFAEFFPAVLVLMSDGVLDSKEKTYLERLVHNLSKSFLEEGFDGKKIMEIQKTIMQEYEYLSTHLEDWKDSFLNALNHHLINYPESKETILDTVRLFATTSQDVNEYENNMVSFIVQRLNLNNN